MKSPIFLPYSHDNIVVILDANGIRKLSHSVVAQVMLKTLLGNLVGQDNVLFRKETVPSNNETTSRGRLLNCGSYDRVESISVSCSNITSSSPRRLGLSSSHSYRNNTVIASCVCSFVWCNKGYQYPVISSSVQRRLMWCMY